MQRHATHPHTSTPSMVGPYDFWSSTFLGAFRHSRETSTFEQVALRRQPLLEFGPYSKGAAFRHTFRHIS